jgi:glycine oxidase
MSPAADVLVIGGGVTGLSVALSLCMKGRRATVVDRGHQPGMSSWAGAGILSPLPPWKYHEDVNRLALAGMAAWPEWAAFLETHASTSAEYWVCGMSVEQVPEDDVGRALAWCQSHQLAAQWRGNAIWLPEIAQARNPRLLVALRQTVTALGGTFLPDCDVTELNFQNGKMHSAVTTCGELSAGQFVLATGAWSALPLGSLPPVPAIRPIRGQIVLYPPGSHALRHIVLQDGIYLVPRLDGHLLVGSTLEDAGFEANTRPETIDRLKAAACELLPSLRQHAPILSWAGLRPGSPDNIPLIDRHPEFDNLWLCLGHYRYGVTMAPASAGLLANLIDGVHPMLDAVPYSWPAYIQRSWHAGNSPKAAC